MKVYLNKAFLVNFFSSEQDRDVYQDISKFLKSNKSGAEIIVDFDIEQIYIDRDPLLLPIVRQIANNFHLVNKSLITESHNPDFHNHSEGKLFFIDDVPEMGIMEEFGCFITDSSNLQKAEVLFNVEDLRIDSQIRSWNVLDQIKHPCNSLVITDNYLFSNESSYDNILGILKSLMPKKLSKNFEFHITIIGEFVKHHLPMQVPHDRLKKLISQSFQYPVNLTIIKVKHHDRYIYSNYYRISSPQGFDLFNNGKLINGKQTSVDCKPFTSRGKLSSQQKIRKEELAYCAKINRPDRMPSDLAGNKINRLLM